VKDRNAPVSHEPAKMEEGLASSRSKRVPWKADLSKITRIAGSINHDDDHTGIIACLCCNATSHNASSVAWRLIREDDRCQHRSHIAFFFSGRRARKRYCYRALGSQHFAVDVIPARGLHQDDGLDGCDIST